MKFLLFTLCMSTAQASLDRIMSIHGSGTTNPSKCYWALMQNFMTQSKVPIRMTYRAVGSTTGQLEFVNTPLSLSDFGSGDLPMNRIRFQGLEDNNIEMMHFPVLAGTVSFFHSIPGNPEVKLTGELLAKIYMMNITTWNHPEILAVNPDLTYTGDIIVARRGEGSSSTSTATQFMLAAAPDHFDDKLATAKPSWPTSADDNPNILECSGSGGMTACIEENPGGIAYIESGHGNQAGLTEVLIQNYDETFLTSKISLREGGLEDEEQAGILPPNPTDDFSEVSFIDRPGQYSWPMVLMTYVYVRTDLNYLSPDEQGLLFAWLEALYNDDYIGICADDFGFQLPSAEIRNYALDALASLKSRYNATVWSFEGSKTRALEGMGQYVISAKRQTGVDLLDDILEDVVETLFEAVDDELEGEIAGGDDSVQATIDALQNEISDLQTQIQQLNTKITEVETEIPQTTAASISGDFTEDDESRLKSAFALAIVSFVMSLIMMGVTVIRFFTKP